MLLNCFLDDEWNLSDVLCWIEFQSYGYAGRRFNKQLCLLCIRQKITKLWDNIKTSKTWNCEKRAKLYKYESVMKTSNITLAAQGLRQCASKTLKVSRQLRAQSYVFVTFVLRSRHSQHSIIGAFLHLFLRQPQGTHMLR